MNNLDEIAHKIAMCAIEQKDNVDAYTAVKAKVLELLETKTGNGMTKHWLGKFLE